MCYAGYSSSERGLFVLEAGVPSLCKVVNDVHVFCVFFFFCMNKAIIWI